MTTLRVNGLYMPAKSQRFTAWTKSKQEGPAHCCVSETNFKDEDTDRLEWNSLRKDESSDCNRNTAGVGPGTPDSAVCGRAPPAGRRGRSCRARPAPQGGRTPVCTQPAPEQTREAEAAGRVRLRRAVHSLRVYSFPVTDRSEKLSIGEGVPGPSEHDRQRAHLN